MKYKTVAIAGFSLPTLEALQHSEADEIWTLNHAFVMEGAIPRIDRLFEIHKEDWFLQDGNLERYEIWLKQEHPFPIYMQHRRKKYPASKRYPFEAICANIFNKLRRGAERNEYFSSSFSYMMAMAIYERFTRIEIYGVDMGNDTEWNYQKPAGEFMIGVAIGRGIQVVLQPNSLLCRAQLYGYDRVPSASRERAMELVTLYKDHAEIFGALANERTRAYNQRETTDPKPAMEAAAYVAMYKGGEAVLEKLLTQSQYFLGRQALEKERTTARATEERFLALTNDRHATHRVHTEIDTDGNAGRAWTEYMEARWNMYVYCGARQAVQKLIDECDMKVVPAEMALEIKDD